MVLITINTRLAWKKQGGKGKPGNEERAMRLEPRHVFICQNCYGQHIRTGQVVDEHIFCSCGYSFYAFGNCGMSIVIPSSETGSVSVGRALKRFVASTGRCVENGETPEAVDYTAVLREAAPERLMDVAIKRLQEEIYGQEILRTKHIQVMCEAMIKGQDIAVRYKQDKDRVVINRMDSRDLTAEWEKAQKKDIPRAGDGRYGPNGWAPWQEQVSMKDEEYFRWLAEQHKRSG